MKLLLKVTSPHWVEYRNEKGQTHREDGPALEFINGSKNWYLNGKLHREDGPAIEGSNGAKVWYQHDRRHRLDGPAYVGSSGYRDYWIDGKHTTFAKVLLGRLRRSLGLDHT